ncbi:hypothetical protein [Nocardia bovistercoris]|uniref:Uncharacterized protein n=1 Tax=Nocardia bovistercoris TaxID=2785916 RepID=A0A931IAH5_9NOCA|nr:hypothetical protein [Nocardia bovistercoris]MBH0777046.1 hypothetical protein [Nocardia bovistercoris]
MPRGTVTEVVELENGDTAASLVVESGVFGNGDPVVVLREGVPVAETSIYPVGGHSRYRTSLNESHALVKGVLCRIGDTIEGAR